MDDPRFDDAAARAAWNAGAEAWVEFVRSGADYYRTEVHGPALLRACAVQPGEEALDLGRGEGFFARELARRGARVMGIDLSQALLSYARSEEAASPLGIEYIEGNASRLDRHVGARRFSLIASCMAVQDMSDPGGCLVSAASVLRDGGRMAISVPHPGTDMAVREWIRDEAGRKLALRVDRYFDTGPAECNWNMERLACSWSTPFWRRTLEEWSSLIRAAGLFIDALFEPRPTAEETALRPELDDCSRVPYFLILRLRKRPGGRRAERRESEA